MENIVCKILGIRHPILQGPMAWASDAALAAAVSNTGGLGIMGIGFAPLEAFEAEIHKAKLMTQQPYGCNLMTAVPGAGDMLEIVIREQVPVVELETFPDFFHTLPAYAARLKDAGIKIIGKASFVEDALIMERAGCDLVSVKGYDGGGHIFGMSGVFSLIPQVADALSVPLINSGGVADGRGIAASLMLGASAVEIGSRFLLAQECPVHDNYKQAILWAKEGDTVLTGTTVHDAVRGLRNELAEQVLELERRYEGKEAFERIQALCGGALRKAAVWGDVEKEGSVVVGQVAGLLNKIQSAGEIVQELVSEYTALLESAPTFL